MLRFSYVLSRQTSLPIISFLPAHSLLTLYPRSAQGFVSPQRSSLRPSFASRTHAFTDRRRRRCPRFEHIDGDEFVVRWKFRGKWPRAVPIFNLKSSSDATIFLCSVETNFSANYFIPPCTFVIDSLSSLCAGTCIATSVPHVDFSAPNNARSRYALTNLQDGGVAFVRESSTFTATNSSFEENSVFNGGGGLVYVTTAGTIELHNSILRNHSGLTGTFYCEVSESSFMLPVYT